MDNSVKVEKAMELYNDIVASQEVATRYAQSPKKVKEILEAWFDNNNYIDDHSSDNTAHDRGRFVIGIGVMKQTLVLIHGVNQYATNTVSSTDGVITLDRTSVGMCSTQHVAKDYDWENHNHFNMWESSTGGKVLVRGVNNG